MQFPPPDRAADNEWEVRPGGMLVQKRNPDSENRPPPPPIRVRVKYGSIYHEINISSQATFGDLKKMLTGPTGLHHQDQKLLYKRQRKDNNAFLDIAGVKDKSKIVLVEDPLSQEKRYLEMKRMPWRKLLKLYQTSVSAFESIISKGAKVVEKDLVNVIELLMNQLLKLDGIVAEGDVKLQRKMQVKRVQKYVETLDVLKIKIQRPSSNGNHARNRNPPLSPLCKHHQSADSERASIIARSKPERQAFVRPLAHTSQASSSRPGTQPSGLCCHNYTKQWETFDPALWAIAGSLLNHGALRNNNYAASGCSLIQLGLSDSKS
ncbi:hypothetical protein HAX54_039558 [Datura stramonium]|uniref:BAG family molecular chaperone regulator 1 n=1 Tax=Datura stramonium TaxID=4076 RepID=A0ABS8RN11_DATST|nr:hypothetical protein [Datura stramonium]